MWFTVDCIYLGNYYYFHVLAHPLPTIFLTSSVFCSSLSLFFYHSHSIRLQKRGKEERGRGRERRMERIEGGEKETSRDSLPGRKGRERRDRGLQGVYLPSLFSLARSLTHCAKLCGLIPFQRRYTSSHTGVGAKPFCQRTMLCNE